MFRSLSITGIKQTNLSVKVPEVGIQSLHVCHNSSAIGKQLGDLQLSNIEGLTLLAINRGGEVESDPKNSFTLEENDVLFFLGQANKLNEIMDMFRECEVE